MAHLLDADTLDAIRAAVEEAEARWNASDGTGGHCDVSCCPPGWEVDLLDHIDAQAAWITELEGRYSLDKAAGPD